MKRFIRPIVFVWILLLAGASTGCKSKEIDMSSPRLHVFVLENLGTIPIADAFVVYGELEVPSKGSVQRTVRPGKAFSSEEITNATVPDSATVVWSSSDGKRHSVVVPVKRLIEDWKKFQGFKFSFAENQLTVFRADLGITVGNFTPTIFTQVFLVTD